MRAIIKNERAPGAVLKSVPVPEPGPGQVLVKVEAAGICGTDLHLYEWNVWAQNTVTSVPLIIGHEFSGEVVAVGTGVEQTKPGDYIAAETHIPCGSCFQCHTGQQHICNKLRLFGIHTDGCFADYTLLPEVCARKIPAAIPRNIAALMEPFGTAVRAAQKAGVAGANAAVIGCGPIGLGVIAAARAMGAVQIIAMDISSRRLGLAEQLGATAVIDPQRTEAPAAVLELTGGIGADCFVDASGSADAVAQGFSYLRKGGRVVLVGLPARPVNLEVSREVVFKEATITGIHGREMFATWAICERMLATGRVDLEPIISHDMPMDRFEDAFRLLQEGQASKIILRP